MSQLTTTEQAQLERCEEVIKAGLTHFIAVGNALLEIKEVFRHKFPDIGYKNFEDYCDRKWSIERRRAYQLIAAAEVVEDVNNCSQTPSTESQARPLTKLPTAQQRVEAWTEAVQASGGKPTAKHVEAAVESVKSRVRPIESKPLTTEQQQRVEEAEKDSETLWSLKSNWRKATKKERAAFKAWIAANN